MPSPSHILMLSAENDALSGGKVGGVADVVRDVPTALVSLPEFEGRVTVVVPSAGFLHRDASQSLGTFTFPFRGEKQTGELFEVAGKRPHAQIRQLVIHHPLLESIDPNSGKPRIYVDDPPDRPFASDATRFACFSVATAAALKAGLFGDIDRVHLHDWHAGLFLFVRNFVPGFQELTRYRTAFTIHNLALQGIRPLGVSDPGREDYDESSLGAWFPGIDYQHATVADPEYTDCVNPMAIGIRLSDAVHVVSPGYADEVCQPSRPHRNASDCVFFGGEGLEADLQQARNEGRLHGVLNGCEYAEQTTLPERNEAAWTDLLATLESEVSGWYRRKQSPRHWLALQRLRELQQSGQRPTVVMTSVTRVVDQKVRLMREPAWSTPLDQILAETKDDAVYLLAGSGDTGYEDYLDEVARRHSNLIFLNGYSQTGADALYRAGDLFLMPSAFEPCGISQMLAMRDGQPCVAHSIGGLKDTVKDNETGFTFSGTTPADLATSFIDCTKRAVGLKRNQPEAFARIQNAAFNARFLWSNSVREYLEKLY